MEMGFFYFKTVGFLYYFPFLAIEYCDGGNGIGEAFILDFFPPF